jgi:ssDNA-binding Zn-finger/Zn-ribbon topoisomerase 1
LLPYQIDSQTPHILAWHTGQLVLKKRCNKCGRPMFIQHRQRINDAELLGIKDFFWSCIGYYNTGNAKCNGLEWLTTKDMSLLHNKNINEFQVTNQELTLICNQKSIQRNINSRIIQHIKEHDEHILCPIHHTPMILREKYNHNDNTLDRYFLGCTNYPSCTQIVKLKSWSQLAGYLHRTEGAGILQ